jgi:hypothetical protein
MHKSARTVLCGGRSAMIVPTASVVGRIHFPGTKLLEAVNRITRKTALYYRILRSSPFTVMLRYMAWGHKANSSLRVGYLPLSMEHGK